MVKKSLLLAIVLAVPVTARGFALEHSLRAPAATYSAGDTVVVDVFLDAEPGLELLDASIVVEAAVLSYDAAASTALPVIYSAPAASYGTTGNQPGYILYNPVPTFSLLYPVDSPFQAWGGITPPGAQQVNVDYYEANFSPATGSGTGIWIASLLFHVTQDFATSDIVLSVSNQGNIVQANSSDVSGSVALSAPITITGTVPEPSLVALLVLGAAGLLLGRRRRGYGT